MELEEFFINTVGHLYTLYNSLPLHLSLFEKYDRLLKVFLYLGKIWLSAFTYNIFPRHYTVDFLKLSKTWHRSLIKVITCFTFRWNFTMSYHWLLLRIFLLNHRIWFHHSIIMTRKQIRLNWPIVHHLFSKFWKAWRKLLKWALTWMSNSKNIHLRLGEA